MWKNKKGQKPVDYLAFEKVHGIQKAERMLFIDFRLRFTGTIRRSDITEQFGVLDAAASKEISEYKELTTSNVNYDRKLRTNAIQPEFVPMFNMSAEQGLGMLSNGFNKNLLFEKPITAFQRVGVFPNKLNVDFVSKVTRALSTKVGLKCTYQTSNSDNDGERLLYPTAIFYDGKTWMFRAFHDEAKSYKNFHFVRLSSVEVLTDKEAPDNATLEADNEWNTKLPLMLKLHPLLDDKDKLIVRKDFGLNDKDEFTYVERIALIYYLIDNWEIDVSNKPSSKKQGKYKFQLLIPDTLQHFESTKRILERLS